MPAQAPLGHDALTGVLTRARLHEELDHATLTAARWHEPAAVCVIGVDHIRYVNDAHGHAVGDALLVRVAAALAERLRSSDALGRVGSDEFAVVLPRTTLDDARAVAHDLLCAVRERARLSVDAEEVRITASIGVVPIDPAAPLASSELLAEADAAMLIAKRAGRDRVAHGDGDGRARNRASLSWVGRIRDALETGGLELHAQPIVSVLGDSAPRCELLVRLPGTDGVPVAPAEFLRTAERFGQMQAIDGWVLARAVDLLARTADVGLVAHVNLAPRSVGDPDLMAFIERVVVAAGIDPSRLVVEITESAAIVDIDAVRGVLERLRAIGCAVALDDFGAGFGSFAWLKHLPFDVLKIDGQFVRDLPTSLVDRLTVGAIASIARGTGMQTVAEYVSDDETLHLLAELGIDFAQGFHVGRPEPLDSLWP